MVGLRRGCGLVESLRSGRGRGLLWRNTAGGGGDGRGGVEEGMVVALCVLGFCTYIHVSKAYVHIDVYVYIHRTI